MRVMEDKQCAICGEYFDPEISVFEDICDECAEREGYDE